jgi:HAAS domain-containing protein
MSATVADAQVRTYLDGVKAHLDDLPDADRDELLEDLEEHLLEVAAEGDGTLEQRLGPPGAYAEELRASAGLPSRDQLLARRPAQRIAERLTRSGFWRSSARLGASPQARAIREFLKELQPGWWVLRGYLAVVAPAIITSGGTARDNVPFPALSGSHNFGTFIAVLAVVMSVWFGRWTRTRGKGRTISALISLAVAAAAVAALVGWAGGSYSFAYYEPGVGSESIPFLHHADGTTIANICPYSSDGKLLPSVLLFDQDGRPIVNTADALPDGRPVQPSLPAIGNAYPRSLGVPQLSYSAPEDSTGQGDVQKTMTPLSCPASIGAPAKPAASAPPAPAPSPGG